MKYIKIATISMFVITTMIACSQNPVVNSPSIVRNDGSNNGPASSPAEMNEASLGADLYTANCMACHRDSGRGGKMSIEGKSISPEDLTETKFKKATDEKLAHYVLEGIEDEGMPAFRNKLTDDQVRLIIAHVRTLQK